MTLTPKPPRPGEVTLSVPLPGAAEVAFIGHARTPWSAETCPKSIRAARETGQTALLDLLPELGPALTALSEGQWIFALYWMHGARRDLLVQRPRHANGPRGTFALRSPARPNPIAMSCVRILKIDHTAACLEVDALDCIDGTPLLDIKPWTPTVDAPSDGQFPNPN